MLKKLFILFKIVVIIHLLFCLVKGIWITFFVCLFNLILFFVADKVYDKLKYNNFFQLLIYLFLFGSLLGGEIYYLYVRVWYFDIIMHVLSSFIVSGLVFYVVKYFNVKMNYMLLVLFIFSFAMMVAALWEITEFGIDMVFNSDMQKDTVITEIKSVLFSNDKKSVVKKKINYIIIGNNKFNGYIDVGLYDTMEDMMCALGGSILFIVCGKIKEAWL